MLKQETAASRKRRRLLENLRSQKKETGSLAGFFDRQNIAALVRATLAACTMGKLTLVAVRALGGAGGGQEVVAAALRRTLLGVTPFRIRHCGIPFNRPHPAQRASGHNL